MGTPGEHKNGSLVPAMANKRAFSHKMWGAVCFLVVPAIDSAHRATLALEHHQGRVDYESVEALGWYQGDDEKNVTGTGKEWYYHWKADELLRVNPSALVPTLIPIDATTDTPIEERAVFESLVAIDYIDAVSGATGTDRLVSVDPYQAARSRIWTDQVNRDCCSPY